MQKYRKCAACGDRSGSASPPAASLGGTEPDRAALYPAAAENSLHRKGFALDRRAGA